VKLQPEMNVTLQFNCIVRLFSIKLMTVLIMATNSITVTAQEPEVFLCSSGSFCGYSATSIDEAANNACRQGSNGPNAVGVYSDVTGTWLCNPRITPYQCRAGHLRCESRPPTVPLEDFIYKPYDDVEVSSESCRGACTCVGDDWTPVDSFHFEGCIAPDPSKNDPGSCTVGNPCNPATGDKYATEVDFENGVLSFIRYYSTGNLSDYGMGLGWTSNHHQRLVMGQNGEEITQISSNGRGEPWRRVNNAWVGDADTNILIEQIGTGYRLTQANNEIENYNESGLLLSKVDTNGLVTTYQYNDERQLEQVTNHYGHSISFTYDLNRISTVTDAHGAVYTYEYNQVLETILPLSKVIYPDST